MKIGLVGAPGSGKTQIAKTLGQELDGGTAILDNYIDGVGQRYDVACDGPSASYIGNMYITLHRLCLERNAWSKYDNVITCGTLIDTSIYATIEAVRGQSQEHVVRNAALMNLLGVLYQDSFGYDILFVLHLEDRDEETDAGQVDKNLKIALETFGFPHHNLRGEMSEKREKAIKVIKEEKLANPNGRRIRSSFGAGQAVG